MMLAFVMGCVGVKAQEFDLDKIFPDPLTWPKNEKFTVEQINCQTDDGKTIYGVAFIPTGTKGQRFPTVVFSHGFNSSHRYHAHYAQKLAENGIAMYMYDFCGGSMNSKSDGKTEEMSVVTEKRDLLSVFRKIKTLPWVDADNLFLSGESQGGFVSAFAGVDLQQDLRGMVLLYPALHIPVEMARNFPEVALHYLHNGKDVPYEGEVNTAREEVFGPFKAGKAYPCDAIPLNTIDLCRAFQKPVLIIHGDKDALVNITYAFQAVKDYLEADLKIIPGANHGFWGEDGVKAEDWMLEFVKKEVCSDPL